jgi:hypothetical protein
MANGDQIKKVLEEDQKLNGTEYDDLAAETVKIQASLEDLGEKITTVSSSILLFQSIHE